MIPRSHTATSDRCGERGFTLAGVLVILTILAVVLAFTVPRMWSDVLQRERDIQTIWVMKQYARAIAEFQRRHGSLPVSLEQLAEQQDPRVLRKLYPNPLSGEMDWILVPPGTPATGGGTRTDLDPNSRLGAPSTGLSPQPQPQPGTGSRPGSTIGPFIGVRPPTSGTSYVALNGVDRYEEWVWTVNEYQKELNPQPAVPGTTPQPNPRP